MGGSVLEPGSGVSYWGGFVYERVVPGVYYRGVLVYYPGVPVQNEVVLGYYLV